MTSTENNPPRVFGERLLARHLRIGWWSLLAFLSAGIVLEGLHGFKALAYLAAEYEMRRLMWRLAHAHGALLALIHIAFAVTLSAAWPRGARAPLTQSRLQLASRCLSAALVLLPGGFFVAGTVLVGGEPNPAIVLVPLGGLLLFVAVASIARAVSSKASTPEP